MRVRYPPPLLALGFLVAGAATVAATDVAAGRAVWLAGVLIMGTPLVVRTIRGALHGQFAADVVASLSIVGAVLLDQPFVGLVIVLMQTGGETLERYAEGKASAAVKALEQAAPRQAHVVHGSRTDEVPATDVVIGDVLLIRPGDMIPCDGIVTDGQSELDTSSLTGEAMPVRAMAGTTVMSGMLNGTGSCRMRVTAPAARSQYARIVDLVRTAQASKAPLQRVADRYAVWFTPITVAICLVAVGMTHDWMRALAILVVATPCPLILAAPVAIIGGVNRAAKRFVIVRNGGALESLSAVNVAVFDKTGTVTVGKPRLSRIRVAPGFHLDTVRAYAAAVEERSGHLLARVLVDDVKQQGLVIPESSDIVETSGQGVDGKVDGHAVRVGARGLVIPACPDGALAAAALEDDGLTLRAYVSIDGHLAGSIEYADELRSELPAVLRSLSMSGVRRVVLLSGDRTPVARAVAERAGIAEAHGDLLPGDKARFVELLRAQGHVVLMVGDGVNDAPALSTANVGVALGAHGAGITAESADVIILVDDLARVPEAMAIGRRTMRIARQSIWTGLGLSVVAMVGAAFGGLRPVTGAVLQEVIDVAVILNALRASLDPHWLSAAIRYRGLDRQAREAREAPVRPSRDPERQPPSRQTDRVSWRISQR